MKVLKYVINSLLSIVICLLVIVVLVTAFVRCTVFNSELLISCFEKTGVYDEKYEYIRQQIDDLMLNAGVGNGFTESIMPSKDLIKSELDNSVKRFLGSDTENDTELEKYKVSISEKFTEEAKRQGLSEESDITEIKDIYCDDIISLISETARMPGESTIRVYTSKVASIIDKYLIYLIIFTLFVSIYYYFINRKKSQFWVTVPYLSAFITFLAVYLIFRITDLTKFTQAMQKSFIMLADNTFAKCIITSAVLLAVSVIICVINVSISKSRGNKNEKK